MKCMVLSVGKLYLSSQQSCTCFMCVDVGSEDSEGSQRPRE